MIKQRQQKSVKTRRYYAFGDYLRERYGCRVNKVTVDAGFT
jgi:radical SAM superfamily enzyme